MEKKIKGKEDSIRIRISPHEKLAIKSKAAESGISVSEYLIRCALNKKLPKRLNEREIESVKELKKFQLNFIRIANFMKIRDTNNLSIEIKELIDQSKNTLKKILE